MIPYQRYRYAESVVTEVDNESIINELEHNDSLYKELYATITSDEGWRYVPTASAKEKVTKYTWGSRDFVKACFYGTHVLLLNSKSEEYITSQLSQHKRLYGSDNHYYTKIKPCIAGLDHLILEAFERGFITKNIINDKFKDLERNIYKKGESVEDMAKQRLGIVTTLNNSYTSAQELDDLTKIIFNQFGIPKQYDELKYELDILTDDINLIYDKKESNILLWLTILTVLSAIIIGAYSIVEHNNDELSWSLKVVDFISSDFGYALYVLLAVFSFIAMARLILKHKKK